MRFSGVRFLAVLAALVAPALTAGCASVTYGTGIPVAQQTMQDISDLMAVGGPDRGTEEIVYKPRGGKVVVPPTNNLPQPREARVATAGGEWPNDPDVAAKRAQAALVAARTNEATPNPNGPAVYRDPGYKAPVLTDAQLAASAAAAAAPAAPGMAPPGMDPVAYQAGVAAMAAARTQQGGSTNTEGAPVRKFLVEPPSQYRVPAANKTVVVAKAPEPEKPADKGFLGNLWPWGKPAEAPPSAP